MVLFINGFAESVFSGSTPEHECIQTYGHVVIIIDPKHVDFGSKLSHHGTNMSSYISYVIEVICKGPLHATT
jgi:hypothetical protein